MILKHPMGTEYFVGYLIRLGLLKKFEGEYFVGSKINVLYKRLNFKF